VLDELSDLVKLLESKPELTAPGEKRKASVAESIYCPKCGDFRKVGVRCLHAPTWPKKTPGHADPSPKGAKRYVPAYGHFICLQCSTSFTWLTYSGPAGPALAVLPSTYAGVVTPNTPAAVGYYLDQAHRSHAVGANSAAVAMYRAALEQLLHDSGFQTGMLGKKIEALEAAVKSGTAPGWAKDMDTGFLTLIKDLGNGSIHTNGGDITKQSALDASLVKDLTELFHYLLFTAYEVPTKSAALKGRLQAASKIVGK
jgi:hypothetical protein